MVRSGRTLRTLLRLRLRRGVLTHEAEKQTRRPQAPRLLFGE